MLRLLVIVIIINSEPTEGGGPVNEIQQAGILWGTRDEAIRHYYNQQDAKRLQGGV